MSKKRIATTIGVTQLFRMFPDEDACYAWLEKVRWNGEPVCPHCGGFDNISRPPSKPHTYWHKDCRKHFTVTTKTCMHATKRPLQDWIYTLYTVLTDRNGISAMELSKKLSCQYRTAWHMLHRIRAGCKRGDFTLKRVVEVDETYVGGLEKNKHESKRLHAGRGPVGKTAVVGMKERGGNVIAQPVDKVDAKTLIGLIESRVEPGSVVITDDARVYSSLPNAFNRYKHQTVRHTLGEYVRGSAHTNSIENVWSVLKRSIHGTWHHVSPKHLSRYVDEVTFRLNEGNCEIDTIDRMESLVKGMGGKRLPYAELVS